LKDKVNENIGEDHVLTSINTPLVKDAFAKSDAEKIEIIKGHFEKIMETLGLDLNDDSLSGSPERVAKMYVAEIFSGLNPLNEPKVSLFENSYKYKGMLVEKNIELYSLCEHHFVPIVGKVHVAYFANDNVIGLSKINRIVQHFAKRPQVQERLTVQIVEKLKEILGTDNVACVIDAKHLCVNMRGVRDTKSSTITSRYSGIFNQNDNKTEFLKHISLDSKIDF
jgi:GTP cyclohydrolase IA